jgi:crotonobetaine/carnitine-CoA ligase
MAHGLLADFGDGSIGGLLASRAAIMPTKSAVEFEGRVTTYGELDDETSRVARGLMAHGLQPGESVGIYLSNRPEYLPAWFGTVRAGGIQVPVNTAYKASFLDYAIAHTDCRFLITEARFADALGTLGPEIANGLAAVVFVDEVPSSWRPSCPTLLWDDLLASGKDDAVLPRVKPSDTAGILLTSGTTGRSKGVVGPHLHALVGARENAVNLGTTARDRLYTCLPLFHGAAQINMTLHAIYAGATLVLSPRFSGRNFWREVRSSEATMFNALGSILSVLLAQPESPDDRNHRVQRVFAAPAPPDLLYPFERRFGVHIVEGYGSTETKNITYNPLQGRKVGSLGRPTASTILEVHDDDGQTLPPGQVGEIVYRPRLGNIMLKGYHKDPEATLENMRGLWWHTGDLGYQDEDGFFYFIDRKKDALRRRGENISSQEVETVLNAHEGVLASAAVAVASELGEDEVLAVLEVEQPDRFDFAALFAHCDRHLPYFMVPRYYRIANMPRTPTGKIQKGELRSTGLAPGTWDAEANGYLPSRH